MVIIRALSDLIDRLEGPFSDIWSAIEPIAIVLYLAMFLFVSLFVWRQKGKGAAILAMAFFVLLAGEAYRLVPHIVTAITPRSPLPGGDGIGRIVSYFATGLFFLMLELFRQQRFGRAESRGDRRMESTVMILFGCIIAVGFVRFNDWIGGNGGYFWLLVRSVLMAAMGMLEALLWARCAKDDLSFRRLPLVMGLLFICWIPYTVLEPMMPELRLLMIPRTILLCRVLWIFRGSVIVRGTGFTFKTYIKRYWTLYLLLFIPIVFFLVFRYYPMSYISLAFKADNNVLMHPWQLPLAKDGGMQFFIEAFTKSSFGQALWNTIFLNLLDLLIGMPMPIIMALLLNELAFPKFKRITQTMLYLPHFLSWLIISNIAIRLFTGDQSVLNQFFGTSIPFKSNEGTWRIMYIVLGIWKECGWNTIIYLAALTGINAELYEAAEVDGAGRLQKIWHVTLPGIRSTIIVLLIMNLGRILGSEFDRPFTLSGPLVENASTTLSIFVYNEGIINLKYSLTTAVGLFQSVVCVIFLVGANTLSKKFGERGIW